MIKSQEETKNNRSATYQSSLLEMQKQGEKDAMMLSQECAICVAMKGKCTV
jgi:hypothetical protein